MIRRSTRGNMKILELLCLLGCIYRCTYGQVSLGEMESWGFNGVESGDVSLMSEKKIKIEDLSYTGEGPAAWFMVGKADDDYNEEFTDLNGVIIPDEDGSCNRLGAYRNDDIELTLPGNMKFTDYDYLSIYCIRFSHNFGYIPIKKDITFPAKNGTQGELDDIPGECDQEPEPRGGDDEEEDDENDDYDDKK